MTRSLELALGFTGAFLCAFIIVLFALGQASPGAEVWPLPGLVFLEVITLGLVALTSTAREAGSAHPAWGYALWVVVGALAALVVLAGFSIGFYLIPSMLCFLAAGLISGGRWGTRPLFAAGLAALAAVVQTGALLLPWL